MNQRRHVWIFTIGLFALCAGVVTIVAQQQPELPQQQNADPQAPPTDPQDPRYKLNVQVELVNVVATVLDEQGKYMDGLKLDDFQVFEDGQEQKISFFSHDLRVPISVGVLIDNSGSMRNKRERVHSAALTFVRESNPDDETFVIAFHDEARDRLTELESYDQRVAALEEDRQAAVAAERAAAASVAKVRRAGASKLGTAVRDVVRSLARPPGKGGRCATIRPGSSS